MRIKTNYKRNKYQIAVHTELVDQLIGMIGITYKGPLPKNGKYFHNQFKFRRTDYNGYYGLDIYIVDNSMYEYDDTLEVLHLHPEDILWAILNINTINKYISDAINHYNQVTGSV